MEEEICLRVELKTQANLEARISSDEARKAEAMRDFDWAESIKETCREERGLRWVESHVQDLRFGVRMLRKSSGLQYESCPDRPACPDF
jgi:hypothetical protein